MNPNSPIPPPPKHISLTPSPTRIPIPLSGNTASRRPLISPSPSPTPSPSLPSRELPRSPSPSPSPSQPLVVLELPQIELSQEPSINVVEPSSEQEEATSNSSCSTYLEDLHAEEEELEHMAATIASNTTPPPVTFSSSIGTTLRRRFTTLKASTSDSAADSNLKDENLVGHDVDEETREALRELEDEEVNSFLERVSKQITEVRATVPRNSIALPEPSSFSVDGKTNWIAFGKAYATSLAHLHIPPSLLAPPLQAFSITATKNYAERLYVITPLSFWDNLLEGSFSRIYRWDPRERTWLYATIYSILWFFDLLPFFPPFAFLLYLLKSIFFPPTPQELLAKSKARKERALQAAALSKSLTSTTTKLGFAMQGAKGLFQGILSEKEKATLVKGLGGVNTLATGIVTSAGKGTVGEETSKPVILVASEKEASIFKILKELVVVLGPDAQEFMAQASDIAEKVKNLITHPEHPAINGVCLRLTMICLALLFCPTWIQIKSAWAYLGFEFFVLWKLREDYPEWRRALNPIWWLLLDAPTDAEYATYILRKRSLESKPLRGAKTLRRLSRTRESSLKPRRPSSSSISTSAISLNEDIGFSSATTTGRIPEGLTPIAKKERRLSASSLLSVASNSLGSRLHSRPSSIHEEEILGSHFAILKAIPGTLIITATKVKFAPSVGLRTMSLKFNKLSSSSSSSSTSSSVTALTSDTASDTSSIKSIDHDDDQNQGFLMNISLEELDGIKKKSILGFEGLEITVKQGKVSTSLSVGLFILVRVLITLVPLLL